MPARPSRSGGSSLNMQRSRSASRSICTPSPRPTRALHELEQALRDTLPEWSLKPLVQALQGMRGVQLIAAMTLVAELQDFLRFDCARQFMARQDELPKEVTDIAWKAQLRLNANSSAWVARCHEEQGRRRRGARAQRIRLGDRTRGAGVGLERHRRGSDPLRPVPETCRDRRDRRYRRYRFGTEKGQGGAHQRDGLRCRKGNAAQLRPLGNPRQRCRATTGWQHMAADLSP
jgi:hypothetical protein